MDATLHLKLYFGDLLLELVAFTFEVKFIRLSGRELVPVLDDHHTSS
jgi:hypothetical protein